MPESVACVSSTEIMVRTKKQAKRSQAKPVNADKHATIRSVIQKERSKFRHFVFTETDPSITPDNLVSSALSTAPGVFDSGLSYIIFSHNPQTSVSGGKSACCAPGLAKKWHYHLFICSSNAQTDALKFRSGAGNVFVEASFYQHAVSCPLTEYAALNFCETTNILVNFGDTFKSLDEILRTFQYRESRLVTKKFAQWRCGQPLWEMHKQSQVMAQEQMLRIIGSGPFKHVLQRVLGSMSRCSGTVDYEQHGWRLRLECSPSDYRCVCEDCITKISGQHDDSPLYADPMLPQTEQPSTSYQATEPIDFCSTIDNEPLFPTTYAEVL